MRQKFSAIRILSTSFSLALALAMSCTDDHLIPQPAANCNRLDGQPRAFPCEFAIEKLDFMTGSSNTTVFETLTPTDSLFERKGAAYSWYKTGTEDFVVKYKVRLTFKRIAEAPEAQDNQYHLYMTEGGIDTEDFLNWGADINAANMAVGETRSQFFIIEYHLSYWAPVPIYMRLFAIINRDTYKKLEQAPYKYTAVRDRAESWIRFKSLN